MSKIIKIDSNFSVMLKSTDTAEIVIYGRIGAGFFDKGLTTQTVDAELKKLPATVKNLTIRINSLGGSFFEGLGIYNRIKSFKASKTVVVEAVAGSAASLIMLCGEKIEMSTGAMMMIHLPWIGVDGNRIQLNKMINDLRVFEEQALNVYMEKAKGISREEVRQKMIDETWLTAQECVKFGFATSVVKTEASKIAASVLDKCEFMSRDKALSQKELFAAEAAVLNQQIEETLKLISN